MGMFKRFIDFITLGSPHPMRRLLAYYAALAVVVVLLYNFVPGVDRLISGEGVSGGRLDSTSRLLQNGLDSTRTAAIAAVAGAGVQSRIEHAFATVLVFVATLALMLPVSWVYMSARRERTHNQSVVQTLLVLPMIVAGVILIVRNSLALAFSLAGVVAAVRFKTSLADARDVVFIFLAIAVGFACGTQVLSVAAIVTVIFNFVLVLVWQYDFGRNVLEPTAVAEWTAPLSNLVARGVDGSEVPDRELVLALTPKQVEQLSRRFKRVGGLVGRNGDKPKYTAVLSLTTHALTEAQDAVETVLDSMAKRWKLDEVVTNADKPSELFYLVRLRKTASRSALLTALRESAGTAIVAVDLEEGEALEQEKLAEKVQRKAQEKALVK